MTGRTCTAAVLGADGKGADMALDGEPGIEAGLDVLAGLIEAVPVAALLVDAGGLIRLANRELAGVLGYQPDELIGRPVEWLLPEHLRGGHDALRAAYLQQPQRRPMGQGRALYARRRDGSELPVEIGLNPVPVGDTQYVLATLTDLTPRERAGQLLYRIVEGAPYGIVVVDGRGCIALVNPQLCGLFGYEAGELLGQPIEYLLPQRYREAHIGQRAQFDAVPRMRRMGEGRDLTALHRDGREFPVEIGLRA